MQKITPFLWFNDNAEEAMHFYLSVFKDSKVEQITRYGAAGPGKEGDIMIVQFSLFGGEFFALNGNPMPEFTQSISLFVTCETQAEVDDLWEKLTYGGSEIQCGWLKDKFGVSWQIVPAGLTEMLNDPDPRKSQSVMRAMMQMIKLDINVLKKAYDGQ